MIKLGDLNLLKLSDDGASDFILKNFRKGKPSQPFSVFQFFKFSAFSQQWNSSTATATY
jgi:hypothetical protein